MSTVELKKGDVVRFKKLVEYFYKHEDFDLYLQFKESSTIKVEDVSADQIIVHLEMNNNSDENLCVVSANIPIDMNDIELLQAVQADALPEEKPEEQPPVNDEEGKPEEKPVMSSEYNRYSLVTIKNPTKRPEVFLYQDALKVIGNYDGKVDGWYGTGSSKAVCAFQSANDLSADGIIGKETATELIKQANIVAGFKPDLNLRIMSIIAFYEVSNRSDAFGMAESDIGDHAGANYGIFQCNSLGSVSVLLHLAKRSDLVSVYCSTSKKVVNPVIHDWFGSTEGIATQIKYFEKKTLKYAMHELRAFKSFDTWENDPSMKTWWERAVLLFCDSIIQNGTMWSSRRRPFWKNLDGAEGRPTSQNIPELYHGSWWNKTLGKYIRYEDFKTRWWAENKKQLEINSDKKKDYKAIVTIAVAKNIVDNIIPTDDPSAKLLLLAQIRSRSSAPTWWYQAVASRRVTDATGTSASHPSSVVNGARINLLRDYQL